MANPISEVLGGAAAIAKGMGITFKEMLKPDTHRRLPRSSREIPGAFSRGSRTAARRERPREVCRVFPVRGGVPGRVYLYRSGREHRPIAHQRRRTFCQGLQYRLQPLYFLWFLCRGLPHGRDYAWAQVRDCQLQYLHLDLPQGTNVGTPTCGCTVSPESGRRNWWRRPLDLNASSHNRDRVMVALLISLLGWVPGLRCTRPGKKVRFEFFAYDFAWGVLIASITLAFTLGSWNTADLTFQDNFFADRLAQDWVRRGGRWNL